MHWVPEQLPPFPPHCAYLGSRLVQGVATTGAAAAAVVAAVVFVVVGAGVGVGAVVAPVIEPVGRH